MEIPFTSKRLTVIGWALAHNGVQSGLTSDFPLQ